MAKHTHKTEPSNGLDAAFIKRDADDEYMGHLAAIVESSDDAIISKSLDGIIRSWNRGSEIMFGHSKAEAIGKHISLIIPDEYGDEEKLIMAKIRSNEIIDHYETIRIKKSGEWFDVSLTVSPIKNKSGTIIGVSKIARDITLRKKAEADHKEVNRELVLRNEEKKKRSDELFVANKELLLRNEEKNNGQTT